MLAGYRALLLMLNEDPAFLNGLPSEVWAKWASITLAYPLPDEKDSGERLDLLTRSYRAEPEVIFKTLGLLIEKENETFGNLYVLDRIEPIWDSAISTYLPS